MNGDLCASAFVLTCFLKAKNGDMYTSTHAIQYAFPLCSHGYLAAPCNAADEIRPRFQIYRLHWVKVSLETEEWLSRSPHPNHLSAKRINNSGWPSITDSGRCVWERKYHPATVRRAVWQLNSSSDYLLSNVPIRMTWATTDYFQL